MSWLHQRQLDRYWGRATLASGRLPWSCSLTLLLVLLVLDQGLGVPRRPAPSLGLIPKDSRTKHKNVTSINESVDKLLNSTGATASQLPSPQGRQTFNAEQPPPQTPRSPTPVDQNGPRRQELSSLRRCCPTGHVTQEIGDCVPAETPVLNLTRLVRNKQCGDLSLVKPVTCSPQQELSVLDITSNTLMCFTNIAFLRKDGLKKDFCVGIGWDGRDKALWCKAKPNPELCHNKGRMHVNKCCHCGQVLNQGKCEAYQASSSANSEKSWPDPFQKWASEKGYTVRPHQLRCEHGMHYLDKFVLGTEGYLHSDTGYVYDDYCLDYFMNKNKTMLLRVQVCIVPQTVWERLRFKIFPIGYSVSIFFLCVTLFFHLSEPKLRKSNNMYLNCYIVSLMIVDINVMIAQLLSPVLPYRFCQATGFMILFFGSSTFCWLTVMCIDVLQQTRICSDFKLLVRRQYSTNKKNLVIYCTFAFGLPLILCIITIVMQVHILEENSLYNPNFGKTNCFFELHNRIPRMLYFDIPMGILFTVNLVVLAVALKNISQFTKTYQEQSKATTTNSSLPPKNEGIASLKNILENFLDRCRSKLSKNNSGKSETEESASNNEDDTTKEGNDEESSSSEGKELQSLATLSSSLESLSNINQNTRNDTAMDSSEAKVEKVYDSENVDHKLEKPARRQTTSGMRKYAKKDFTVEFWHKVFIFTLMIVCWATEVASAFIKPDEIWAVTDILNTFQGSFQFVLLLRNNFKRDLCSNKYPALFNMIDALESVLKSCFSGLKSCLCHMCKR